MKKVLKIVLIIVFALVVVGAGGIFYITNGLRSGSRVEISAVHPSALIDGFYVGDYVGGRWSNEVSVTIDNGRITHIEIFEDVTFPQEGLADELFEKVIGAQNTTVDAVSGATVTSKAYLKAIENALNH